MSDVLGMTELFSTLMASKSRMAEEAALHADQIVRNVLVAGITGSTEKIYAGGATTFNQLVALTNVTGVLTIKDLLRAMTQLEINRAPRKNGEYFAIVAPQIAYDLMLDTQFFIPVNTYQDKTNVVRGEVGKWFNIRVVIATVPFREAETDDTEGTFQAAGTIYSTFVTGSDAYGTPIMAGNSPYSPHIYINDKADKSDPLNQTVLAGWKSYWTAVVLNAKWAINIRSISGFA
jgi:N4-gp56 family major capsid protein